MQQDVHKTGDDTPRDGADQPANDPPVAFNTASRPILDVDGGEIPARAALVRGDDRLDTLAVLQIPGIKRPRRLVFARPALARFFSLDELDRQDLIG